MTICSPQNILIVKLSAIGDVIHALPVAHALKQKYPMARITWIVEKPAFDLLTNNPDIDEILVFDKPKFKSLTGLFVNGSALSRQLKSREFDLALDLQGLFKSAAITWLSGSTHKFGYCNMREMSHLVSKPICGSNRNGHVVDRYLDVARAVGCDVSNPEFPIHITEQEAAVATAIAAQSGLNINRPYVVLAPGTNWPTKCWPTSHYAGLADKFFDMPIIPVIIGGPGDKHLAQEIISRTHVPPIDLTSKTSLKQLAYLIKHACAFIGGDTGPMHLAIALGTPVITMFGPTDPKRNGPYHGNNVVLRPPGDCTSCWGRSCSRQTQCLDLIKIEDVWEAVKRIVI